MGFPVHSALMKCPQSSNSNLIFKVVTRSYFFIIIRSMFIHIKNHDPQICCRQYSTSWDGALLPPVAFCWP